MPPKSILRNAPPPGAYTPSENATDLDRKQVLENTRANAKLHDMGSMIRETAHNGSRSNSVSNGENGQEHLKWDEANLYRTEMEKAATMKIDEPKTPYQGAVGDSEYYMPDEEEEAVKTSDNKILAVDELDGFSLGEPQYKTDPTVQNSRIEKVVQSDDETEEEQEPEVTSDERKRRFEEMRKEHYHMKGDILKHPLPIEDEE
ncbi:protein Glc8p [Trichomonascus vanleenenianus]|uniref:PP1-complex regulatory subunit GLC8 n=1 Tax=Trichomonascus vanleenenianus TaxID=2268995 RepID=UPI003ECA809A